MGLLVSSTSKLPGINWLGTPSPQDMSFLLDTTVASEIRNRLQLLMGSYRTDGPSYGICADTDPKFASQGSGLPLVVQQSETDSTKVDILPGIAVTKAGNVIVISERVFNIELASSVVVTSTQPGLANVVFLEYSTIDDESTNAATIYQLMVPTRRIVAPAESIIKVVKLSDFNDPSQFPVSRLNDIVVLAVVSPIQNSAPPPNVVLDINMVSNVVFGTTTTVVRPWFSAVDQEHRSMVGTGSDATPHKLAVSDLSDGSMTIYQQNLRAGVVLSRDLDAPGCAGTLCHEMVDFVRVQTDSDGTVTGIQNGRYVKLLSYPTKLLGVRYNKLDSNNVPVEDTSLAAIPIAAEVIPHTNILVLSRQNTTNEAFNTTYGFSVYYTSSDAARPPALPHEIMNTANDTITFKTPLAASELIVSGGKGSNTLSGTTLAMGQSGPVPKVYDVWLDNTKQFLLAPQILVCSKLLSTVGTAIQTPDYSMYGPAKIRVALWNAPVPAPTGLDVKVQISGTDADGASITETLQFTEFNWSQPVSVPNITYDRNVFLFSTKLFYSLTSFNIVSATNAGPNALVSLWADIEPPTTSALNDALHVARLWWNGQSVTKIQDFRPVLTSQHDKPEVWMLDETAAGYGAVDSIGSTQHNVIAAESFLSPVMQDNVLSKRNRHVSGALWSCEYDDVIPPFNSDGTAPHPAREWYYSNAVVLPATAAPVQNKLLIQLFSTVPANSRLNNGDSLYGLDYFVQYQLFTTPSTPGSWLTPTTISSQKKILSADLTGGPYFKVRVRVLGKGLTGFALVLRSV